jgi:TolB-like protein/class 3 adenylate cyclase/Tfp pilus assembly protein PilF
MAEAQGTRKLEAILAADVAGYSRLMQQDDEGTVARLGEYRIVFRESIEAHHGRVVDMAGDSVLAVFGTATGAVRAAQSIQSTLAARNEPVPEARRMRFRIGLNLGEIIEKPDGTVYGDGVNVAARLESISEPGGVTVSGTVFDQVKGRVPAQFDFIGEQQVKNIAEPVRAYRLVAGGIPVAGKTSVRKPGRRRLLVLGAGGVVAAAVAEAIRRWRSRPEATNAGRNRVAVLPLTNISADSADEYFADGMTEEIIARLSQIRGLDVIARTSVMQYKGKSKSVADIGRELNVTTVLEGSVRRAADKVRITVQLIDAANQGHLWAENYDRELKDVFAIQSDIAQRVAQALKVQLGAGELGRVEKRGTDSLEAHNLYLLGRHEFNKFTEDGFRRSVPYYEQSIQKDAAYALPYSGLADAHHLLGAWGLVPANESIPKAKAAALKALELDSTLGDALATLAYVRFWYDRDPAGAERDFRQAVLLTPTPRTQFLFGLYLEFSGRPLDGLKEIERARQLDPLSMIINANVGLAWYAARNYDNAIAEIKRALQIDPGFPPAYWWLALAYAQKKMHGDAVAAVRKAGELVPAGPWREAFLAYILAVAGHRDEALQALARLKSTPAKYNIGFWLALVNVGLGEHERAIAALEADMADRSESQMLLKVWPDFDPLRKDARFTAVLKKLGLET